MAQNYNVKLTKLADHQNGFFDNYIILKNYITLQANYNPQNQTIDLLASCNPPDNYIFLSPTTIIENIIKIEFSDQLGLLDPSNNLIIYAGKYKIWNSLIKAYTTKKLEIYKNNVLDSTYLSENPNIYERFFLKAEKDDNFSFGTDSRKSTANTLVKSPINFQNGECIIKQIKGNNIENLLPLNININENTVNFSYLNLPITPGIYEFIVGFAKTTYGSVTFKIEIN